MSWIGNNNRIEDTVSFLQVTTGRYYVNQSTFSPLHPGDRGPADAGAENWRHTRWDVIVVGGGHNGLTCAAYLAKAGKRVLVLEARERLGGACTLEETWPGYTVSPCAYLAGLLHPKVIEELNFPAYGYDWTAGQPGMFVPFDDGSSIQLWEDDDRCEAEDAPLCAPGDLSRLARHGRRHAPHA